MNSYQTFFILVIAIASASAQWRGDIGYGRSRGGWEVRGGTGYDFTKARETHGYHYSNGNSEARAQLRIKFGRRRRSVQDDAATKKMCQECISVETLTSPEKLNQYASIQKVDFSMIAKFKRFYQNGKETVLNFEIKEVLSQPPTGFNITDAKVFNIYAEKDSCAMVCLKDFVQDDYVVTGAMFHGRLIIHDKLVLFHPGLPKVNSDKYEVPGEEIEEEADEDTSTPRAAN